MSGELPSASRRQSLENLHQRLLPFSPSITLPHCPLDIHPPLNKLSKHGSKPWTRSPRTRGPLSPNNDPEPPGHATAATAQPRRQHHCPTTRSHAVRTGPEPRSFWADGFDRCVSLPLSSFTYPPLHSALDHTSRPTILTDLPIAVSQSARPLAMPSAACSVVVTPVVAK